MKRSLFLAMILLFGASSVCNISYAQTKREQRKAEKQFADLKKSSDIAQAIEDRSFSFIVTEINSRYCEYSDNGSFRARHLS